MKILVYIKVKLRYLQLWLVPTALNPTYFDSTIFMVFEMMMFLKPIFTDEESGTYIQSWHMTVYQVNVTFIKLPLHLKL